MMYVCHGGKGEGGGICLRDFGGTCHHEECLAHAYNSLPREHARASRGSTRAHACEKRMMRERQFLKGHDNWESLLIASFIFLRGYTCTQTVEMCK